MLDSADLIHANAWQQMVNAIKMNMIDFLQKMLDLYNQANGGIEGIGAIQNALDLENQYHIDDTKLSLKEVTDALELEDDYNAYQLVKAVGEDIC